MLLQSQRTKRQNVLGRVTAIAVAGAAFIIATVLIFGGSQQWGISEIVGIVSAMVGVVGLYLSFTSQRQQQELELLRIYVGEILPIGKS